MKTRLAILGSLVATLAVGCSNDTKSEYMSYLDQNNDDALDTVEASSDAALTQLFQELDEDSNGELDVAEFSKFEALTDTGEPDVIQEGEAVPENEAGRDTQTWPGSQ